MFWNFDEKIVVFFESFTKTALKLEQKSRVSPTKLDIFKMKMRFCKKTWMKCDFSLQHRFFSRGAVFIFWVPFFLLWGPLFWTTTTQKKIIITNTNIIKKKCNVLSQTTLGQIKSFALKLNDNNDRRQQWRRKDFSEKSAECCSKAQTVSLEGNDKRNFLLLYSSLLIKIANSSLLWLLLLLDSNSIETKTKRLHHQRTALAQRRAEESMGHKNHRKTQNCLVQQGRRASLR